MPTAPLVSVLLAVHDGEPYMRMALESVLRQTMDDLELIVVDDASTDPTPDVIAQFDDRRLRVIRNDEQLGLAASLNRGLDEARGRYVARLDADDVALPRRLEHQLARIRATPGTVILGTSVCEIDGYGAPGAVHAMPATPTAVRWHLLFSSPFFHPTVLLDREHLERHGFRFDPSFLESEDYDLWARVLATGDGANVSEALVLYRVHAGQASQARRELQRAHQLDVARREMARVAPHMSAGEIELAWRIGMGERGAPASLDEAAAAYVELARAFAGALPTRHESLGDALARPLLRAARQANGGVRLRLLRQALELDRALPLHASAARAARRSRARTGQREARAWLDELETSTREGAPPIRVAAVFPEPTPYRAPLLDRVAALPEIELTVVYAADTVARRTWRVEPEHRAVFLGGMRIPGARKLLHHDYPLTPGIASALRRARPQVVVISGWSTFAAQAAIAWCRLKDVPYVLVVESHDEGPRAGWRRKIKGAVVPPVVQNASGVLVTGTLARNSMLSRGAPDERVRVFANTIDVEEFGERANHVSARRTELRRAVAADPDDIVVLSVARLVPEKSMDVLIRALAAAADPRLLLVLAGDGPERTNLERLAAELDVRAVFLGDTEWEKLVELYVASDVFALLSEREPWGVVVNEAAACGLPLVLSERVGAAHDLLVHRENGFLVRAGDVEGAAGALRALASDPALRRTRGARSREIAHDWGYGPSVEAFLAAVREAVADRG
ncbi:MAG TPA: glycosyltransferase [Gaiellaceae bacterium]|nr:glycosyltransferase [Gaiellaceae bacterium]